MGPPIAAAAFHPPCTGHDYDQAGKPPIAQDDAEACADLVGALTSDAHRLLGHLPERELAAHPARAVALLALVAGQDVEPAEDGAGTAGRWRTARRVAADRVISAVDPDARHAHKTVTGRPPGRAGLHLTDGWAFPPDVPQRTGPQPGATGLAARVQPSSAPHRRRTSPADHPLDQPG